MVTSMGNADAGRPGQCKGLIGAVAGRMGLGAYQIRYPERRKSYGQAGTFISLVRREGRACRESRGTQSGVVTLNVLLVTHFSYQFSPCNFVCKFFLGM
jgi:hypothetical protein